MKRFLFCILLMASLSACTGASASGAFRCNQKKEICINLTAEEPIVIGKPVNLTAIVTSKKDIQDIGISLEYFPNDIVIAVDGLQKRDLETRQFTTWNGGLSGLTTIKANQPLTFTWQLLLPSSEGACSVFASVSMPQGFRVTDSVSIYFTSEGVKVNYSGTQFPITEEPLPTPDATQLYLGTPSP
jgi:hypothetical protein